MSDVETVTKGSLRTINSQKCKCECTLRAAKCCDFWMAMKIYFEKLNYEVVFYDKKNILKVGKEKKKKIERQFFYAQHAQFTCPIKSG